ncbi:UNVERIFIED_CONTAM: hypothetical protein RMT77_013961 [Armadillidium vulgare]
MMFGIVVIFSCLVTFAVSDQFEVRYNDESRNLHHHYESRKANQLSLGEVVQKCGKECNTKVSNENILSSISASIIININFKI